LRIPHDSTSTIGYIYLLKPEGKLIIITPQEAGFRSDSTHIEFMDFAKLKNILNQLGLIVLQEYSFPFSRLIGRFFTYNEFVLVGQKKPTSTSLL